MSIGYCPIATDDDNLKLLKVHKMSNAEIGIIFLFLQVKDFPPNVNLNSLASGTKETNFHG